VNDQMAGRHRYQALLALNDNSYCTGSFACVPGSANELKNWLKEFKPDQRKYVPFPNPLHKRLQKIPLRAGDMVVWDVGTAHANFSNQGSTEPRLTQYVRMIPHEDWAIKLEKQALSLFWEENPKVKAQVSTWSWTPYERYLLGLN